MCLSVDPCDPNPCKNNGNCRAKQNGGYRCVCVNGYTGADCGQGEYAAFTL